ncbi:hypothetical protein LOK49_LG04G02576 [Camellia lanceoleosa]|uniref:Uncharacterized protein n=1 Tax=Camellia lanceoleosa TaxID=1840588 RepID=A0ACC0I0Y1_9ERIC|nr:hypothetical protein LOK49_LG04G02576 [Camellia lanceoleosa]
MQQLLGVQLQQVLEVQLKGVRPSVASAFRGPAQGVRSPIAAGFRGPTQGVRPPVAQGVKAPAQGVKPPSVATCASAPACAIGPSPRPLFMPPRSTQGVGRLYIVNGQCHWTGGGQQ